MNFELIQYSYLTNNVLNGIFYGIILALIALLALRKAKPRLKNHSRSTRSILRTNKDLEKILSKDSTNLSGLREIKGIGAKRALELELAGVKTISDLAKRSPKHLAKKTGIPITQISKWIIEANKLTK